MDRSDIVRRLRRVLPEEDVNRLMQEFDAQGGAHADKEPHWLDSVLAAANDLPLPEVPPVVSQDLQQLFDGPALPLWQEAVQVADTRTQKRLAGVRGGADLVGWSISYTSEVADLVLDVWPLPEGTFEVEGQVLPHGTTPAAYRAHLEGPTSVSNEGDALGRFSFDALPAGSYRLVVNDGRIQIAATVDLGAVGS